MNEWKTIPYKAAQIYEHDTLVRKLAMFNKWIDELESSDEYEAGEISEWDYIGLCDWLAQRRRALGELGRLRCNLCGHYRFIYEDDCSSEMYCDPCTDILEKARIEQDILFPNIGEKV